MVARVTRQQLYDMVWGRPMTALAREFALSDVAVRKICVKHGIPTPPVGYWAKKAHGKRVAQTPLPPGAATDIVIREGPGANETDAMLEARLAIRAALAVAGQGGAPNPIVERTLVALAKARPGRDGLLRTAKPGLVAVAVQPSSLERAGALLRALVECGERAGAALVEGDQAARWAFAGETIAFELSETADQIEHVPTSHELAAVAKWQRERDAQFRRTGYIQEWGEPKIPKWEHRYQGRLAIRLEDVRVRAEGHWRGAPIRRVFADSRTREVANAKPRIMETVAAIAAVKRSNRLLDERRQAIEAEAAQRRAEVERQRLLEQQFTALLAHLLDERAQFERLQALLDALEAPGKSLPRTLRLLRWARAKLASMEARHQPAVLEERLATAGLFGDDV